METQFALNMNLNYYFSLATCFATFSNGINYCDIEPERHFLCKEDDGRKSYCTSKGEPKIFPTTDLERENYVKVINKFRQKVAHGKILMGDVYKPRDFGPTGADIFELEWDAECEEAASNILKYFCVTFYSRFLRKFSNIFERFEAGVFSFREQLKISPEKDNIDKFLQNHYLIKETQDFLEIYDVSQIRDNLTDHEVCNSRARIIMRSELTLVGCAMSISEQPGKLDILTNHYIVCVFGGIERYTKQVYTPGAPCSLCPEGSRCSETYPGLCKCDHICYSKSLFHDEMDPKFFDEFAVVKDFNSDQRIVLLSEVEMNNEINGTSEMEYPLGPRAFDPIIQDMSFINSSYAYFGPKKGFLYFKEDNMDIITSSAAPTAIHTNTIEETDKLETTIKVPTTRFATSMKIPATSSETITASAVSQTKLTTVVLEATNLTSEFKPVPIAGNENPFKPVPIAGNENPDYGDYQGQGQIEEKTATNGEPSGILKDQSSSSTPKTKLSISLIILFLFHFSNYK